MTPPARFTQLFVGADDLWAAVDFESMPPQTRNLIERARDADRVSLADEVAKSAALTAQLMRTTAIASDLQEQLHSHLLDSKDVPR
jgi:hypothetical protein